MYVYVYISENRETGHVHEHCGYVMHAVLYCHLQLDHLSPSPSPSPSLSPLSLSLLSLFLVHSYLTARIHLDAELAHANYRTRLFTFLPAFLRLAFVLCDDRNARELLRPVFKIYGINMELASVDRGKSKE